MARIVVVVYVHQQAFSLYLRPALYPFRITICASTPSPNDSRNSPPTPSLKPKSGFFVHLKPHLGTTHIHGVENGKHEPMNIKLCLFVFRTRAFVAFLPTFGFKPASSDAEAKQETQEADAAEDAKGQRFAFWLYVCRCCKQGS